MMAMEGEALEAFYPGLSAIATKQCVVQMAMISASGDEIALVEVENSADVETVKAIFQARIDYQVGDGETPGGAWYPAPTEMWKSESRIVSNGKLRDAGGSQRRRRRGGAVQRSVRVSGPTQKKRQDLKKSCLSHSLGGQILMSS